jgi:pyruvate kinase
MHESIGMARRLLRQLLELRADVVPAVERLLQKWHPTIGGTPFAASAGNLAAYLAFRRRDLRAIQSALAVLGVSSLGRSEAHVIATLDAVIATLTAIARVRTTAPPSRPSRVRFMCGARTLNRRTDELLGPAQGRSVRIMVTLPSSAATDRAWVRRLIESGADCVRINCAHDHPEEWMKMIRNVRDAARAAGRHCRVVMDLCGPRARIASVLPEDDELRVKRGDRILLTKNRPEKRSGFGLQAQCLVREVFDEVKPGAFVLINEGRIRTIVEKSNKDALVLRVTQAREKGEKFRAEMALNFPEADLHISPLTAQDLEDLDFVVQHADIVGYSFVQTPEDISLLLGELDVRRARFKRKEKLGLIAKIETAKAVHNLPEMIVRAAARGPFGVMIARGDLAIEVGFLRIAELQEEILWICEAAHVPVIWATQVLESLAKKGVPTRAELTDAAMSERAECVMLNKGPFIFEALGVLDELLRQTAAHHTKKTAKLRALRSWEHLHKA